MRLPTSRSVLLLVVALSWLGVWPAYPALAGLVDDTAFPCRASLPALDEAEDCQPTDAQLLLPDLLTLTPHDLRIVRLADGTRELRLANTVWNAGEGPLELEGTLNPTTQKTRVAQHLYTRDGEAIANPVGEFTWHPTHQHWHFGSFSLYELWRLTPEGGLEALVSSSGKVSYCVIDTDVVDGKMDGFSPYKRYGGCDKRLQGLSVGWGDTYKSFLDGQSIHLEGVQDGFYALKSTANPEGILLESDYDNNASLVYLEIRREEVALLTLREYIRHACQEDGWWTWVGINCPM